MSCPPLGDTITCNRVQQLRCTATPCWVTPVAGLPCGMTRLMTLPHLKEMEEEEEEEEEAAAAEEAAEEAAAEAEAEEEEELYSLSETRKACAN